ncbi:MAG: hypothetical protein FRX49_07473 [Trebouxia sp. A1-2]|nr:MAG: hypothetical protein FRX49_07473 [Trebouxia sp. A1-2]
MADTMSPSTSPCCAVTAAVLPRRPSPPAAASVAPDRTASPSAATVESAKLAGTTSEEELSPSGGPGWGWSHGMSAGSWVSDGFKRSAAASKRWTSTEAQRNQTESRYRVSATDQIFSHLHEVPNLALIRGRVAPEHGTLWEGIRYNVGHAHIGQQHELLHQLSPIGCTRSLEVPGNAIQGKHIFNHLFNQQQTQLLTQQARQHGDDLLHQVHTRGAGLGLFIQRTALPALKCAFA